MLHAIQELAERKHLLRKKRRRRQIYRRLTQFNLKFLFFLTTAAAILFTIGPPITNHLRARIEQTKLSIQLRQKAITYMKGRRPVADVYRDEHVAATGNGFVLRGDCLINGKWHRYWIYETDSSGGDIVIPLSE